MATENELIEDSRRGDRAAFAELVHRYEDRIYRLAQKVCAQAPSEAEGVRQETFVTALEKIQQFENKSALGTWLYRIAANLCFMRLRAKRRSSTFSLDAALDSAEETGTSGLDRLPDPASDPVAEASRRQLQEAVAEGLGALPSDYRIVVFMRDVQRLSAEETAKALHLSVPAVKSRLHRGRVFLQQKLKSFAPLSQ